MAFPFSEKANVTTGGALPVFLHIYWHLWVAFAFLEKANVALCLVVWTHICHLRVVYAVSGTPGTWNQPNFWNLGPLVQLEIFLYGICLHLLHLPHLLFIPTRWGQLASLKSVKGGEGGLNKDIKDDGRCRQCGDNIISRSREWLSEWSNFQRPPNVNNQPPKDRPTFHASGKL